jgi:hypothetical protein
VRVALNFEREHAARRPLRVESALLAHREDVRSRVAIAQPVKTRLVGRKLVERQLRWLAGRKDEHAGFARVVARREAIFDIAFQLVG